MSTRRLSVVRHRYNAVQVLSEILRDDLDSSSDVSELNDSFQSDDDLSSVDEATENEQQQDLQHGDSSDSTVDYDVTDSQPVSSHDNHDQRDVHERDSAGGADKVGNDDENDAESSVADDDDDDDNLMRSRCGTIVWRRRCPPMSRHVVHNVLTQQRGIPDNVTFDSVAGAFQIFFDGTIIGHILHYTNRRAEEIQQLSSNFQWNTLSEDEFYAFLGLNILAGVQKSRNQRLAELWDEQWGVPVFRATMSLRRFINILRALRFDDKTTRVDRISETGYQATAVQEMLDMFLEKCRSSYKCGPCVTIDEQLITFHGRCRFRMYIPSKPGKYGLKMWIMADSETFYCADAQLYAGKVGNQTDVGQGTRVVLQLSESIRGSGRNVTTDNFFTSYSLAQELMARRLSLVGTVRSNRKEVPSDMMASADREVYSSSFGFSNDGVTMVSYVPKKNKAVILMSTQHRDTSVTSDEKKKPEIIQYYNVTKVGVDILDKLVRTYSCKRSIRRWTVALFFNLIDIAAYNALVLWISANPGWSKQKTSTRRMFLRELGMQLVNSHATARIAGPLGKRRRINESAMRSGICNMNDATSKHDSDGRRRRCCMCSRQQERKTTTVCSVCGSAICKQHSTVVVSCRSCVGESN